MSRPLKLDGTSGIIEMTDTQLEGLTYYLRVAYAAQLNGDGDGRVYVGSGETEIGTASDTSYTAQTASQARNNDGTLNDYPAAPGTAEETDSTYSYRQDRTFPSFPGATTLDDYGFVILDGSTGLRTVNTEAQIYAEVIAQTITAMRTGDEVGTYRVGTSSPGTGWTSKGTWFVDTTYDAGATTYNLYLKTSGTAPTLYTPLEIDFTNNGIQEAQGTFNENHNMIQQILLPALTRRIDSGDLNYSVATTQSGITRGTFYNTAQTESTTSQSFTDPTYYTTSTPSGTATTQDTYYLLLA